ncbi:MULTISPECIES: thiamine biosynthesis protein ThiC [unclassified Pseudoalteromonas]|uniref:thiamine biosynthesis protein ThiC n=1 Tax=unclassified Pseudoalteromonas TaxID=194690 RepID=UPI001601F1E1|nr:MULTISPECIES: thiamine biosynthesis protein ThiC [unclassified Pseudoalteromonas]MBB1350166.1 thiamine biosynthesis protein ThiC [Pseudoalteromonas sp. SG45-3]MBB1356584.1 thiamine biosynthesis protein ThiC [Pseudoalteromonas sp. SG45-6]
MEFTNKRTTLITASLLLVLTLTQAVFTALYSAEISFSRQYAWGLEAVVFTLLVAFAGSAMVQAQNAQLGWSAITFSAILNIVQVSIGLTLFSTFGKVAGAVEGAQPLIGGVVSLSFMIYYAAKLLLGLAALVFGLSFIAKGGKAIGGLTALAGGIAMLANGILITFGRDGFLPSAVAGASGMIATLLLAICLISLYRKAD